MTHNSTSDLPTPCEIDAMTGVLLRRYGTGALAVARHFMREHEIVGDRGRASLWGEVCARVEKMSPAPTLS